MLGIQSYFRMEKIAFKCAGMSLQRTDSICYRIYSICFIVLILITYPLMQLGDLFKQDFDSATDVIIYEFTFIIVLAQTFVVYFNRQRIGKLLHILQKEPFLKNREIGGEEERLMKECAFIVTVQTLTYWITVSLTVCAGAIVAVVKRIKSDDPREWVLPYGAVTVLNITYSPNYEITLSYQCLSTSFIAFQYCVVDSLLPGVLCYTVYQFKILQHNIKCIMSKEKNEEILQGKSLISKELSQNNTVENHLTSLPWEDLKISVKETIEYHLAIIEVSNEIEDIFNTLLLVKFLSTLGILCFMVYVTSMISMDNPKVIQLAFELVIICVHMLFVVCFWGDQVNHESQKVGIVAFGAKFVGTDLRFQKALVLIIRRSQKGVRLTAGKFAPVCLPTFAWVVRTSWSIFLVLRNFKKSSDS